MGIALVTGGAGFIGSHLVDALLERGADVRVLDNLSTGSLAKPPGGAGPRAPALQAAPGRRIELMIGDVRDDKLVAQGHAARRLRVPPRRPASRQCGRPGTAKIHTVNVQGTLNVLQAAATEGVRRRGVRVVRLRLRHAGRDAGRRGSPGPAGLGVRRVQARGRDLLPGLSRVPTTLETVILRYFNIYGPRQNAVRPGRSCPPSSRRSGGGAGRSSPGTGARGRTSSTSTTRWRRPWPPRRRPRAVGRAINVGLGPARHARRDARASSIGCCGPTSCRGRVGRATEPGSRRPRRHLRLPPSSWAGRLGCRS